MANIVLPQVDILSEVNDSTNILVEQDGVIQRANIETVNFINNYSYLPKYANDINDCIDNNAIYILPDNYLYAKGIGIVQNYIDMVVSSVAPDSDEIYNSIGYKLDTYISSSSGHKESTNDNSSVATGLMPFELGTYYVKGGKWVSGYTECRVTLYNANKTLLGQKGVADLSHTDSAGLLYLEYEDLDTNYFKLTINKSWAGNSAVYFALTVYGNSQIIISKTPITTGTGETWINTGRYFAPNIKKLEDNITSLINQNQTIPEYWKTHLNEKVDEIRLAMETAGYNKSSFLWYHDAHWSNNEKNSPMLLKYLYENTPINKINFGGDVLEYENASKFNRDDCSYVWNWRKLIRNLPNHHSVIGNHDDGNLSISNGKIDNFTYSFLFAPEETPNIIRGGKFYYYIDEPSEQTRYLYLDTASAQIYSYGLDTEQQNFVKDALLSTPENWHIVAIAHIWVNMNYTVSPPVPMGFSSAAQTLLDIFDAYNARENEYVNAQGIVRFCIGGHTHIDGDFRSTGGIPVILTETDSRNIRSGLTMNAGTISENSINAIIADYDNNIIKIIRIGRGKNRTVSMSESPTLYTNQLPISTDLEGNIIGYKTNTRISISSGVFVDKNESPWYATGFIPVTSKAIVRLKNCTMYDDDVNDPHGRVAIYYADANKLPVGNSGATDLVASSNTTVDDNGNVTSFTVWSSDTIAYVRIVCQYLDENSIITVENN